MNPASYPPARGKEKTTKRSRAWTLPPDPRMTRGTRASKKKRSRIRACNQERQENPVPYRRYHQHDDDIICCPGMSHPMTSRQEGADLLPGHEPGGGEHLQCPPGHYLNRGRIISGPSFSGILPAFVWQCHILNQLVKLITFG